MASGTPQHSPSADGGGAPADPAESALTSTRLAAADSVWNAIADTGDPDVPVAVGGHLDAPTLIGAYRRGIFPWPPGSAEEAADLQQRFGPAVASGRIPTLASDRPPTLDLSWWSPDPRAVIPVGGVHLSYSLRRTLRNSGWTTTLDRRFAAVVQHCGEGRASSWITPALATAYQELHRIGFAHSTEVWDGDQLIGGQFGLLVGAIFVGESMFYLHADASKVALADLAFRLQHSGGIFIDTQYATPHMQRMGAIEIPRDHYRALLDRTRDTHLQLDSTRQPVHRLAL